MRVQNVILGCTKGSALRQNLAGPLQALATSHSCSVKDSAVISQEQACSSGTAAPHAAAASLHGDRPTAQPDGCSHCNATSSSSSSTSHPCGCPTPAPWHWQRVLAPSSPGPIPTAVCSTSTSGNRTLLLSSHSASSGAYAASHQLQHMRAYGTRQHQQQQQLPDEARAAVAAVEEVGGEERQPSIHTLAKLLADLKRRKQQTAAASRAAGGRKGEAESEVELLLRQQEQEQPLLQHWEFASPEAGLTPAEVAADVAVRGSRLCGPVSELPDHVERALVAHIRDSGMSLKELRNLAAQQRQQLAAAADERLWARSKRRNGDEEDAGEDGAAGGAAQQQGGAVFSASKTAAGKIRRQALREAEVAVEEGGLGAVDAATFNALLGLPPPLSVQQEAAEARRARQSATSGGRQRTLAAALTSAPRAQGAVARVLAELAARDPGFKPTRALDFNAGYGAATWAALQVWPSAVRGVLAVEPHPDLSELGLRCERELRTEWAAANKRQQTSAEASGGKAGEGTRPRAAPLQLFPQPGAPPASSSPPPPPPPPGDKAQTAAEAAAAYVAAMKAGAATAAEEGEGAAPSSPPPAPAPPPLPRINWVKRLPDTTKGAPGERLKRRYDLVVVSHALLSIPSPEERATTLAALWELCGHTLVVVEHGSPEGFQAVMEARTQILDFEARQKARAERRLQQQQAEGGAAAAATAAGKGRKARASGRRTLWVDEHLGAEEEGAGAGAGAGGLHGAGAHVVAPCPHDGVCPLQASSSTSWCHFGQRVRAATYLHAGPGGTRGSASAFSPRTGGGVEDVKLSYVVLRRGPRPQAIETPIAHDYTPDSDDEDGGQGVELQSVRIPDKVVRRHMAAERLVRQQLQQQAGAGAGGGEGEALVAAALEASHVRSFESRHPAYARGLVDALMRAEEEGGSGSWAEGAEAGAGLHPEAATKAWQQQQDGGSSAPGAAAAGAQGASAPAEGALGGRQQEGRAGGLGAASGDADAADADAEAASGGEALNPAERAAAVAALQRRIFGGTSTRPSGAASPSRPQQSAADSDEDDDERRTSAGDGDDVEAAAAAVSRASRRWPRIYRPPRVRGKHVILDLCMPQPLQQQQASAAAAGAPAAAVAAAEGSLERHVVSKSEVSAGRPAYDLAREVSWGDVWPAWYAAVRSRGLQAEQGQGKQRQRQQADE